MPAHMRPVPWLAAASPPVPAVARCQLDNHSAAVPKGQLTPLFERVLRDFPQFSPVALSTDPYVVLLNDFVLSGGGGRFPACASSTSSIACGRPAQPRAHLVPMLVQLPRLLHG